MNIEVISKYFPQLSESQYNAFAKLQPLYAEWNEKINVISRKDIDNLYTNHILHSLALAKFTQFAPQSKILDVGTGGGFPGIPLAIMFPDCNFHLIDSIGKKISVVQAVADSLGLANVKAEHIRVEQVKDKYDFVVSRAVTRFDAFYRMVRHCISNQQKNQIANGILYLKGGDFDEEIAATKRTATIEQISSYFDEPFFETKKIIHMAL